MEEAREQVAALVNVRPQQVVFTSGGTEANNLFIKGAAEILKPAQVAVSAIEHPCVARPAEALARRGWSVRKLAVTGEGVVNLADVDAALQVRTGIVSVMLAIDLFVVGGGIHYQTPMLAAIAADFGTDAAATGWIPTASFGGMVIGMLFFVPLGDLALDPHTELHLGLVHLGDEAGDAARLTAARNHARVDGVGTECGWGRKNPELVPALLSQHRNLVEMN